ncbi:MAG: hypothetical protein EPN57_22940 [Paraburkholderia sp.]|nr:MAG: hypothetical protein EPN57_22940 [Paraburkholderia sp.]
MKTKAILGLVVAVTLSACGGGGDGGINNVDPQGFWHDTGSDGRSVDTLVLGDTRYFAIYSANGTVSDMVQGTLSVNGNDISDTASIDFSLGGTVAAASLSGSVIEKQTLSATVSKSNVSNSFTASYDPSYDNAPTTVEVVGTWSGTSIGSTDPATLNIAGDGTFSGTSGACTFAGSATPKSDGKNVFEGTITYTSSSCGVVAGTSVPFDAAVSGNRMLAAGVNATRAVAFAFLGTRQ